MLLGNLKFNYYKLYKVFETEHYFYLYINKNYSFVLSKDGFNIGSSKDFYKFIKRKIWYKRSWYFERNQKPYHRPKEYESSGKNHFCCGLYRTRAKACPKSDRYPKAGFSGYQSCTGRNSEGYFTIFRSFRGRYWSHDRGNLALLFGTAKAARCLINM